MVNDEDMIPRLSFTSTVRLTHQLSCLMRACPLSHWSIYRDSKFMNEEIDGIHVEAHFKAEREVRERHLHEKKDEPSHNGSKSVLINRKASPSPDPEVAVEVTKLIADRRRHGRGISVTLDGDIHSAVNNLGDRQRLLENESRSDMPFYGHLRQRSGRKGALVETKSLQFLNLRHSSVGDHVRPRAATRVRAQYFFQLFPDLKSLSSDSDVNGNLSPRSDDDMRCVYMWVFSLGSVNCGTRLADRIPVMVLLYAEYYAAEYYAF